MSVEPVHEQKSVRLRNPYSLEYTKQCVQSFHKTPSSKIGEKYEGGLTTEDLHPKFEPSSARILHEIKEAFSSSA